MRSGDAYSRNFKNVRGDDVRTKATRKVLVIVCNSFRRCARSPAPLPFPGAFLTCPGAAREPHARVLRPRRPDPLDHKPAKKRTYLHSDIRENELPALMVAAFTFAWKIIHALSDGKASCIQAFEPAWLRAQRLGFWQETASCPLTRFIIATAPSTHHLRRRPNTEGYMTSVAGIVEYIARTEGPDTSAAVGADIENAGWTRPSPASAPVPPYSYKLAASGRPTSAASSRTRRPTSGPSSSSPHQGKGKRTRNSAPAFLRPAPRHGPQQRPGQQRIDEMLPRQSGPRTPAFPPVPPLPPPPPDPRAGLRASRRPSGGRWRRARRARRRAAPGLWAQRLQEATAFRAELEAGFRAERNERGGGRGELAGVRGRDRGAGEGPRLQLPAGAGAHLVRKAGAREASRAKIDAAEEQAAREEARTTRASGTCTTEARGGALAATLTWLLGGTPTASAVIGVGFGYAAKSLYAPGCASQAAAGMRPAGR
eukprot:tig00021251_g19649.t1